MLFIKTRRKKQHKSLIIVLADIAEIYRRTILNNINIDIGDPFMSVQINNLHFECKDYIVQLIFAKLFMSLRIILEKYKLGVYGYGIDHFGKEIKDMPFDSGCGFVFYND